MITNIFRQVALAASLTIASSYGVAEAKTKIKPDPEIQRIVDDGTLENYNYLLFMESPWIIDLEQVNDGEIDDKIDQLYKLARINQTHPIILRIGESPGGTIRDGLNFIDALHSVNNPIIAICAENAHSMGGTILVSLKNGLRLSTRSCDIMLHAPRWPELTNQNIESLQFLLENAKRNRAKMVTYSAEASGLTIEETYRLFTEHDLHLTPQQALGGGLIDAIIPHRENTSSSRNRITPSGAHLNADILPTQVPTPKAKDYKDLFCEATHLRQLNYCEETEPAYEPVETEKILAAPDTTTTAPPTSADDFALN